MESNLSPLMDSLLSCACAGLVDTMGGEPKCACTLMPGTLAPADWCNCRGGGAGCGMAWVRLVRLFPATNSFPSQDTTIGSCASVLAAVLEVGVYRCQPKPGRDGRPPSVADQTEAALIQVDDAMALHQAIVCCPVISERAAILGQYTPVDGGGCGGGAWQVTVSLAPLPAVTPTRSTVRRRSA